MEDKPPFNKDINRIVLLKVILDSFDLNDIEKVKDEPVTDIMMYLGVKFEFFEKDRFDLAISTTNYKIVYAQKDDKSEDIEELASISVKSVFGVDELETFLNINNELTFKDSSYKHDLISMSLSHARVLFYQRLAESDSGYNTFNIPNIPVDDVRIESMILHKKNVENS